MDNLSISIHLSIYLSIYLSYLVMDALLEEESLVDVTLSAESQFIRAHRVVLSACSPYFRVRKIEFCWFGSKPTISNTD